MYNSKTGRKESIREYQYLQNLRSLVVRALERDSKDPGSSPGGDACFSH